MTLIWPIGAPSLYFAALYKNRDAIDPYLPDGTKSRENINGVEAVTEALAIREVDPSIQHLQLLYGPFEPQYLYWEVGEMCRRLLATSALLLMGEGPVINCAEINH